MQTEQTMEVAVYSDQALSELELLASALEDAMDAHAAGVIIGPRLDALAYERAARRARKADATRSLRAASSGDAA